jgi:hypothetical protein
MMILCYHFTINITFIGSFCYFPGGRGVESKFDKRTLKRLQDLELLEEDKKKTLMDLIDTYIRDSKARQAYTV